MCNSLLLEEIKTSEVIFKKIFSFCQIGLSRSQPSEQSPPSEKTFMSLNVLPVSGFYTGVGSITFAFFSSRKASTKLNAINEINSRLMNVSLGFVTGDKSGSFLLVVSSNGSSSHQ